MASAPVYPACFAKESVLAREDGSHQIEVNFIYQFVDFFSQPQVKTHLGFHFLRNKCCQTTISKMMYGLFRNMSAANEQVGENPIIRCLKI